MSGHVLKINEYCVNETATYTKSICFVENAIFFPKNKRN